MFFSLQHVSLVFLSHFIRTTENAGKFVQSLYSTDKSPAPSLGLCPQPQPIATASSSQVHGKSVRGVARGGETLCEQMPSCSEASTGPSPLGVAGRMSEPWSHSLETWAQGSVSHSPAVLPWTSPSTFLSLRVVMGQMRQRLTPAPLPQEESRAGRGMKWLYKGKDRRT